MTDKAYYDGQTSFRASVDLRSRLNGGARPAEKIVSLPPPATDDPLSFEGRTASGSPTTDLSSAFELIAEASEAIRISEARAEELQQQLDRFTDQTSAELSRLKAEVAASEQRAAFAEARANEAELWLVRLHDAVQSAFSPLQRRPKAEQIADRSSQASPE